VPTGYKLGSRRPLPQWSGASMIASLGLILLCQLVGEVIARALALPLPGPVLGMLLLLMLLLARDHIAPLASGPLAKQNGGAQDATGIEEVSRVLLANLSLMFVPAGVGVVQKLDLIATHGLAIAAVLVISVVITLLVTVAVFVLVGRWVAGGRQAP
jgi:holin-like protein